MQREYDEESKQAETSSEDLIQKWKELLQPETDDESGDEMVSPTNSEPSTCSSDSSFITDSSYLSSTEDDEATKDRHMRKSHRKKGTKKQKVVY